MDNEEKIYQRIGEFVVSFQWIENKLREIGWFILDPERKEWPPKRLRKLNFQKLIDKVHKIFLVALPSCNFPEDHAEELRQSFGSCVETLHELRKARNRILHSAFLELKAGGDVQAIIRSDPLLGIDDETGEPLFDQQHLKPDSFDQEMARMAEVAVFLNKINLQLVHRYSNSEA